VKPCLLSGRLSTSAVILVETELCAAVWLMKLNRLSSVGSHNDDDADLSTRY